MVNHVVMFRFRDRSAEHLAHCRALLEGLPSQVAEIRHFDVGLNELASARAYDLCLYSHFDSFEDLAAYQVHPAHVEVATYLRSAADATAAVDYSS
jgi:hypothetical protein